MGLIDMIEDANSQQDETEMQALTDEIKRKQEIKDRRAEIIKSKMEAFAASLDQEFLELVKPGSRFFMIGGLVLSVRAHGIVEPKKLESIKEREVLWQHRVSLVGYDIFGHIREVAVGTLSVFDFAGIRKVFNSHRNDLEFAADKVVSTLFSEDDG